MTLRNILVPFILFFTLTPFFSSASATDSSTVKKSSYNPEVDRNKMMLLDAELELNQALLAGVKASLDTLNHSPKMNHAAKDTAEKLKVMKREREQKEMRTYLEYMRDSLTTDCNKMIEEKQLVQGRIDAAIVQNATNIKTIVPSVVASDTNTATTQIEKPEPVKVNAIHQDTTAKPIIASSKVNVNSNSPPDSIINVVKNPVLASNETKGHKKQRRKQKVTEQDDSTPEPAMEKPGKDISAKNTADNTVGDNDSIAHMKSNYYYTIAQKSILEKDYQMASEQLKASLELWKNNFDAWFALAGAEEQLGAIAKALDDYNQCLTIRPATAKVYYNMATLYLEQGDKAGGLKNLNQAIQLDPRYIAAYMKRGSVYNDTADYDAAIADYNYVLKLNMNYYPAYKSRGYSKLMQRKFKDAMDDFTRYIIYDQSDAEVYYYRGLAKIGDNDWLDGCMELSMSANMGYEAAAVAQKKNCE